jgi:hypothetical protein
MKTTEYLALIISAKVEDEESILLIKEKGKDLFTLPMMKMPENSTVEEAIDIFKEKFVGMEIEKIHKIDTVKTTAKDETRIYNVVLLNIAYGEDKVSIDEQYIDDGKIFVLSRIVEYQDGALKFMDKQTLGTLIDYYKTNYGNIPEPKSSDDVSEEAMDKIRKVMSDGENNAKVAVQEELDKRVEKKPIDAPLKVEVEQKIETVETSLKFLNPIDCPFCGNTMEKAQFDKEGCSLCIKGAKPQIEENNAVVIDGDISKGVNMITFKNCPSIALKIETQGDLFITSDIPFIVKIIDPRKKE